ncbi:pteridine reductase [Salinimonas lutimaris]|uniref:pteridine reductase n=1 Tax=Salinimonas lutimaris TaxID=914153 RepID=UPI0010BF7F99|nr:pteridine reductase [Salinimonas lutimaris]
MQPTPVSLVTGGAKRIGAQLVKTLHQQGHNVIIHYHHSQEAAQSLADALNQLRPASACVVQADLCNLNEVSHLAARAQQCYGRVDVLVNNASAFYPTPLGSVTQQDWQALTGSNVQGPLFLIQALADALTHSQGCVINMIDMHIDRPLPQHSVYVAAKTALASVTRSLAAEMAPAVRVNGIAPGAILWPERSLCDAEKQNLLDSIPLNTLGTPDDIAHTMLFLLQASYITGQIIYVDGGRSIASGASA